MATADASVKGNVKAKRKLVRSVSKYPTLYDRNDTNYKKRIATENCWELVASEIGDGVSSCKRRWNALRAEYERWLDSEDKRKSGHGRAIFPLSEDLKFLRPFRNLSDLDSSLIEDFGHDPDDNDTYALADAEAEADPDAYVADKRPEQNKKTSTPPTSVPRARAYNSERRKPASSVDSQNQGSSIQGDAQQPAHPKSSTSEKKVARNTPNLLESESEKAPEFFIKQTTNSKGIPQSVLIIKKKTRATPDPLDTMNEVGVDSSSESAAATFSGAVDGSVPATSAKTPVLYRGAGGKSSSGPTGRGRKLRSVKSLESIKQLPIQKAKSPEQRITRLQRRKSLLLTNTTPVKMTPVPRHMTSQGGRNAQQSPTKTNRNETTGKGTAPKPKGHLIFPPEFNTMVSFNETLNSEMANDPAISSSANKAAGVELNTTANVVTSEKSSSAKKKRPVIGDIIELNDSQVSILSSGIHIAKTNTVISKKITGNNNTIETAPPVTTAQLRVSIAPLSGAQPKVSLAPSSTAQSKVSETLTSAALAEQPAQQVSEVVAQSRKCERGVQVGENGLLTDASFLESLIPQMHEMNGRQKLMFKQKVFLALMETFDDATDFPNAGEVQHFNINTPSGFENITDPELRLMRELVSMVSAAKRSPHIQTILTHAQQQQQQQQQQKQQHTIQTVLPSTQAQVIAARKVLPGTFVNGVLHRQDESAGIPRHVIQRVFKQPQQSAHLNNGPSTSAASGAGAADPNEKRIVRVLQLQGAENGKSLSNSPNKSSVESSVGNATAAHPIANGNGQSAGSSRQNVLVSQSSGNRSSASSNSSVVTSGMEPVFSPNTNNSLTALFGPITTIATAASNTVPRVVNSSGGVAGSNPQLNQQLQQQIRQQMGRRYSICGSGLANAFESTGPRGADGHSNATKRRMPGFPQSTAVPQQRARYASNVNTTYVSPGNLKMHTAGNQTVSVKMRSPNNSIVGKPGVCITPIQTISGGGGASYNVAEFVQPMTRNVNGNGMVSGVVMAAPSATSQMKRGLVVANPKTIVMQKTAGNSTAAATGGAATNAATGAATGSAKVVVRESSPYRGGRTNNPETLASLLNTLHQPAPSASGGNSSPTSPKQMDQRRPQTRHRVQNVETAATIAADDFSIGCLKHEPLEDDNILGM